LAWATRAASLRAWSTIGPLDLTIEAIGKIGYVRGRIALALDAVRRFAAAARRSGGELARGL
jgi:hypothetical protein